MANSLLEPETIVSKNPIDDVIPDRPPMLLGAGVDPANKRVGISGALAQTPGVKNTAKELVDELISTNRIHVQENNLSTSATNSAALEEHFEFAIENGVIDKQADIGMPSSGCVRVPNPDVDFNSRSIGMEEAEQGLIPELIKKAKDAIKNPESSEKFTVDSLGAGKMNDAIIRSHLEEDSITSNDKVVDSLLKNYIDNNPEPEIQHKEDEPMNEISGNGKIISIDNRNPNKTRNNAVLIALIVALAIVLFGMAFMICYSDNSFCKILGFNNV